MSNTPCRCAAQTHSTQDTLSKRHRDDLIDIDDSRKFAILRKDPITEVNLITYAPQICLNAFGLRGAATHAPCSRVLFLTAAKNSDCR